VTRTGKNGHLKIIFRYYDSIWKVDEGLKNTVGYRDGVHKVQVSMCKLTKINCIGFRSDDFEVSCANCVVPLLYPDSAKLIFEDIEREIKVNREQTTRKVSEKGYR